MWKVLLAMVMCGTTVGADVDRNVIYGMVSGGALLMDVHKPAEANGYGVVFIAGSGFHAPLDYGAAPLNASGFAKLYVPALTEAGYTVFVINHRAAPRFRYPAAVEDAQRAVRFVRHDAARWGLRPERIGGVGGSSGGHLIHMLGVLDGDGDPTADDPVERESAKLQAIVARAAGGDLTSRVLAGDAPGSVASFLGMRLHARDARRKGGEEYRRYRDASPITHVTADDAPTLMLHGDADERVSHTQSVAMGKAFDEAGVTNEVVIVRGGGHGPSFPGAENPPDYLGAMVSWFDGELREPGAAPKAKNVEEPETPEWARRVERNVVFGMVSGLALLMDVYHPKEPNGRGVVHLTGSGWHGLLGYDAVEPKASRQVEIFGGALVKAGYTVFALNTRLSPSFRHPAHLEDAQRAVRFVRHHAERFGIHPYRIGAVGGSSGGHLTAMLGVLDGVGNGEDPDPVERESARVQCIAPWAPPVDLVKMNGTYGRDTFASMFGMRLMARDGAHTKQRKAYVAASPMTHVSADDAPAIVIHGDADELVPLEQGELLVAGLAEAGVPAKLVAVPDGGHGGTFPGKSVGPEGYLSELVGWFDRWLQ